MPQEYICDAAVVQKALRDAPVAAGYMEVTDSTFRATLTYALERVTTPYSSTSQQAAYSHLLEVFVNELTDLRKTYASDHLYDEICEAVSQGYVQFRRATVVAELQAAYYLLTQAHVAMVHQTLPGYTPADHTLFELAVRHGRRDLREMPVSLGSSVTRDKECVVFSHQALSAFVADLLAQKSNHA
jgi:hypothetical protein